MLKLDAQNVVAVAREVEILKQACRPLVGGLPPLSSLSALATPQNTPLKCGLLST